MLLYSFSILNLIVDLTIVGFIYGLLEPPVSIDAVSGYSDHERCLPESDIAIFGLLELSANN